MSAQMFELKLKNRELQKHLFDFIGAGTITPKFIIDKKFEENNRSLDIEYFDMENLYKLKSDYTDDEIKVFIEENKDQLKREYIDFRYVILNPKNLIGIEEFNQDFFDEIDVRYPGPIELAQKHETGKNLLGLRANAEIKWLDRVEDIEYMKKIGGLKEWAKARKFNNQVPLMKNNEVIEFPVDQSTLTKRYTEEVISFINKSKDSPFFIFFTPAMPHVPLYASKDFMNTSKAGLYGDTIEEIDWSVGRILSTLKDINAEKNTLVIFNRFPLSDTSPTKACKS